MGEYLNRVIEDELDRALSISSAVNVIGPRACGKTTTAHSRAASSWLLDPADEASFARALVNPYVVLEGPEPRLVDEWQLIPTLWDAVRRSVDKDNRRGRFMLSGSAWPEDDARRHSGAGRILNVRMRPMSLMESKDSTGAVSLAAILSGTQRTVTDGAASLESYADLIVRGGWPDVVGRTSDEAQTWVGSYLEALGQHDFPLVAGTRRAPARFEQFIAAYATLTAHPAPLSTVGKRLGEEGVDVGRDFPGLYHDFASRMFVVEDQPSWEPARRSRARLVLNPKRHLVDPSLAASAMGLSSAGLLADWETFGLLFESLVVRDLRIYAQASRGSVRHYRTHDARAEMDAVIEFRDRKWIGVEVKLGYKAAEAAAQRLVEVASAIQCPPTALMVVVGGPTPAFQLSNGVWIVPLSVLGP